MRCGAALVAGTFVAAALAACGPAAAPEKAALALAPPPRPEPPHVTATLSGVVRLSPPKFDLPMDASPHEDRFRVNDDGSLPHAFLCVTEGRSLAFPHVPDTVVRLDMRENRYSPHVAGVVAGQDVVFSNSDAESHVVHVKCRTREWNAHLPGAGGTATWRPLAADAGKAVCDMHSWEYAWLHVVAHPYFAVSGSDTGRYEIPGLVPGRHLILVWHETWARREGPVEFWIDLYAGENVQDVELAPER